MAPSAISEITNDPLQKRPACVSCSRAKRRCTKQLPACARCRGKRHRCVYPMTRIVLSSGGAVSSGLTGVGEEEEEDDDPENTALLSPPSVPAMENHSHTSGISLSRTCLSLDASPVVDAYITNPWFLTPSSWKISPSPANASTIAYPDSGLDYFLSRTRAWLNQWIDENRCTFIHPRLYGAGAQLPDPLRDAYSAYQTYRYATATNKTVALQIANASAKRLIENQYLYDDLDVGALDTTSHLARTQALFILQLIRLFDGDVRSRGDAEATSSTLIRWSYQLMQSAASSNMSAETSPNNPQAQESVHYPTTQSLHSDGTLASTWRAWILSESIRRTWIVVGLMEAAFSIFKQGFADCPGSISFTSRRGLWDAESPREWLACLQRMRDNHGFPMTCAGIPTLLAVATPDVVDDFGNSLIVYGTGREDWADWIASSA